MEMYGVLYYWLVSIWSEGETTSDGRGEREDFWKQCEILQEVKWICTENSECLSAGDGVRVGRLVESERCGGVRVSCEVPEDASDLIEEGAGSRVGVASAS